MTDQERIALEELKRLYDQGNMTVILPDERSLFERTLSRVSGVVNDLQRRMKAEEEIPIGSLGIRG